MEDINVIYGKNIVNGTAITVIGFSIIFVLNALGSAFVFFFKKDVSPKANTLFLGFAAGGIVAVNRGTLSKVTSSVALKYTANSSNSRTLAPYIGFLIGYNNGGKYTECIVKNASLNVGTLHIETWKTGTIFKRVTHTWDQKQNTGRNVAKS